MVNMTCTRIKTTCPNGAALVYRNTRGEESIDVSFLLNSEIVYQPMNWRWRMDRAAHYATLKQFYRQLRRNGITQRSLQYLAGGARRGRNGGWAIGTPGHRDFQSWLSKARSAIAQSRQHLAGALPERAADQRNVEHAI